MSRSSLLSGQGEGRTRLSSDIDMMPVKKSTSGSTGSGQTEKEPLIKFRPTGDPTERSYASYAKDWFLKLLPVFPLIHWFPTTDNYKENIRGDIIGGLTVGALLIPQGIAYALVAKLSAVYGLYSGFVPCLIYGFWGTSGQLSVGPIATISQISADAAASYYDPMMESTEYTNLIILITFQLGVILTVFGLINFGFITNFISHPVIEGYKVGVAFAIGVGQLQYVIGRPVKPGSFFTSLGDFFKQLPHASGIAIAYAVGTVLVILFIRKWQRSPTWVGQKYVKFVPGVLVATFLSILISYLAPSDHAMVVGPIQAGFPTPAIPDFSKHFWDVLPHSLLIAVIAYIESYSIAVAYALKHGDTIDATREFYGIGLGNLIGAFFLSFPVSGTPSRTVLNDLAGSRTVANNLLQAFVVLCGLLFLTPLFENLPQATLGAIVILALAGLINFKNWVYIYKVKPADFLVPLVTFICILVIGIAEGILIGVGFSIILLVLYSAFPGYSILGRKKERKHSYEAIYKFEPSKNLGGIAIYRFDADLHFANFPVLQKQLQEIIASRKFTNNPVKTIIIDASGMHFVDSTGASGLKNLARNFGHANEDEPDSHPIAIRLAGAKTPVRRCFQRAGFLEVGVIGPTNKFYETVHDAVVDSRKASSLASIGDAPEVSSCSICFGSRPTHIMVPCGHVCACVNCVGNQKIEICPQCNDVVDMVVRFHNRQSNV